MNKFAMMNNNFTMKNKWASPVIHCESFLSPGITINIITDEVSFLELQKVWDDVLLNSSATIYQSFDWLFCWWKHFAVEQKYSLHIVTIYFSGKLIGAAPFFIHTHSVSGFRIFRRLRLIGCSLNSGKSDSNSLEEEGPSDYLDVISLKGFEETVSEALALYLKDARYFFDEMDFQNVPEESFVFKQVLPRLKKNGFELQLTKTDVCPKIDVPSSLDDYLRSVSSSTRRRLKQSYSRIQNDKDFSVEEIKCPDLSAALQNLKHLHQKRWNELGYPGLFSDNRFERFQNEVCKSFFEKGWLWFKVIRFNNGIIASRLAFEFKGRIYDYLSGFDYSSDAASKRPGILLLLLMIKDAISKNLKTVDLLRGSEEYKFDLAASVSWNYRTVIFHPEQFNLLRLKLFSLLRLQALLMGRIRREKSIVKLFLKRSDIFLSASGYIKFCFQRLKSLLNRSFDNSNLRIRLPKVHGDNRGEQAEHIKREKIKDKKIHEAEVNV